MIRSGIRAAGNRAIIRTSNTRVTGVTSGNVSRVQRTRQLLKDTAFRSTTMQASLQLTHVGLYAPRLDITHEVRLCGRTMLSVAKAHPLAVGSGVAGLKAAAVDMLVQRHVEGRESIDWRRTAAFSSFGFLFSGVWQYTLFVKVMPRLCPLAESFAAKPVMAKLRDGPGLRQLAIQVGTGLLLMCL